MPTAELPETLDLQNKRNIVLPPSAPVPGPTGSSIRQILRFVLITLAGIICNDSILFLMSSLLHPVLLNPTLWANISKLIAIGGNVAVSYLGMRLWVFHHARHEQDGTGHI